MATNIESSFLKKQSQSVVRDRWRSRILASTTIGIGLAILYSAISPSAAKREVTNFAFPKAIALDSWQQIDSKPLLKPKPSEERSEIIKAARSYTYAAKDRSLKIDMRYLVGTRGNVTGYLTNYTTIAPEIIKKGRIEEIAGIGYYITFIDRDRVYLSSCISPRADSNVTQKQFSQHRYRADWQLSVWLKWLQGKKSIRDRRCLWVHLSTQIENKTPELAKKQLEIVWVNWYRWWLPRFPNL